MAYAPIESRALATLGYSITRNQPLARGPVAWGGGADVRTGGWKVGEPPSVSRSRSVLMFPNRVIGLENSGRAGRSGQGVRR